MEKWREHKEAVKQSVFEKLWDKDGNMFYDVCAHNLKGYTEYKKSCVKALTNFYPFLTDIADSTHIKALYEHLLNEKEFWESSGWLGGSGENNKRRSNAPPLTIRMKIEIYSKYAFSKPCLIA